MEDNPMTNKSAIERGEELLEAVANQEYAITLYEETLIRDLLVELTTITAERDGLLEAMKDIRVNCSDYPPAEYRAIKALGGKQQ